MENTQPSAPTEDDLFSLRANASKSASSRLHFPANSMGSNRQTRARPDSQHIFSGIPPPVRRGSPLNPQNVNQAVDSRRQPWPPDVPEVSSRHRRIPSFGQQSNVRLESQSGSAGQASLLEPSVFSDEYDLAHEDPRILQDVQRALELKARREARIKRETTITPEKATRNPFAITGLSPKSSVSNETPASPTRTSFSPSISRQSTARKASTSTSSEVDFSPATGALSPSTRLHPTPCSSDNGKTFDWSGVYPEDGDKRWTISIGKKKDKDKLPFLGVITDEQEQLHRSKLSELRRAVLPQTMRKADIVSRQLSRRYALVNGSIESSGKALNLASISRWYAAQSETVKQSLEKAEPFTWLKHLEKQKSRTGRSRWNLSALIMEQCVAPGGLDRMQTIPENSAIMGPLLPVSRQSRSPSFLSSSRGTSSLEAGPSNSPDDLVSFEPLGELKRDSLDALSGRSAESALSSVHSNSSQGGGILASSRNYKDDPRSYLSRQRPRSPGSSSSASTFSSEDPPAMSNLVVPDVSIQPPSSENLGSPPMNTPPSHISSDAPTNATSPISINRNPLQSRSQVRVVSPPPDKTRRNKKKMRDNLEKTLRREYENKASILQEVSAHNHRIRQFLNRISSGMRDYDTLQQASGATPGVDQRSIPRDVLDTFSHDPSAVTGSTRRLRGWRAVEDIHQRIHRQRSILKAFIDNVEDRPSKEGCLLDDPIDNILRALKKVEIHKDEINHGNEEVAMMLASVEKQYNEVKDVYDQTAARVSVVYPELSNIIALEESYRDQYQQFWDFALDALTLLLDTVTPVWRTYGKVIGEDVRDFLIIPLYRNEFTGEAKTYPIKGFPSRSLRHWVGLFFFLIFSVAVNILQIRAAVTSTLNFRLQSIPYDGVRWTVLPFFWIATLVQWVAVICEFVVVFLQLGVIMWWTGWSVRLIT